MDYRDTHLVNDEERGERDNGQSLPRPGSSQDIGSSCKFKSTVAWDNDGYYISLNRGGGCNIHSFHPKLDTTEIPLPPCLLSESQRKDLLVLRGTRYGEGTCSAYILNMTGRLVPCINGGTSRWR